MNTRTRKPRTTFARIRAADHARLKRIRHVAQADSLVDTIALCIDSWERHEEPRRRPQTSSMSSRSDDDLATTGARLAAESLAHEDFSDWERARA